jgi:KipI family sensor histidine kinase inhibitor
VTHPRARPVGEAALEFDPAFSASVRGIDDALRVEPFPGFRESVPSQFSLLVLYDPSKTGFEDVQDELLRLARQSFAPPPPGPLHTIPVVYDGPDLDEVVRACGVAHDTIASLHASVEYTASMLGFMPGFAYLGPLPEALAMPRRATPRLRVPAGAVAIAGGQTAIYPSATPGGWTLIGRTSVPLFDPHRDPPCLIQAGDRVRFRPVRELPEPAAVRTRTDPRPVAPAVVEVLDGGLMTTVQDLGRFGHRRFGIAWAGAMDAPALRAANLLLGNEEGAAGLECTAMGPALLFLAPTRLAVTGGDLGPVLHRDDLGPWPLPAGAAVLARAGNRLVFTGRRTGCRAYVALSGGIDVPLVLGSRATDMAAAFGGHQGRALRVGDRLALGTSRAERDRVAPIPPPQPGPPTLRVVLGPQDDHFTPASVAAFLSGEYAVTAASDRVGCRLDGPLLRHIRGGEIPSDGLVPGCVQVPPDGRPIVTMADGPTTGGYPKVATVIGPDLPVLAQVVGGEGHVRFSAVTVDEAQRAALARGPLSG